MCFNFLNQFLQHVKKTAVVDNPRYETFYFLTVSCMWQQTNPNSKVEGEKLCRLSCTTLLVPVLLEYTKNMNITVRAMYLMY